MRGTKKGSGDSVEEVATSARKVARNEWKPAGVQLAKEWPNITCRWKTSDGLNHLRNL